MPRPGPGVADQAPPPPRSPHRGNGGAIMPRSPHRGNCGAVTPRSPHRGNGGAVTPQSPLRIRQDGKFYERLLTKESSASAANLSFRYYWAEPGAVPFVWESQPGTPKDVARMAAGALPAITPPPSYLLRHGNGNHGRQAARHEQKGGKKRRCRLKRIRIGFIASIFRRLSLGKAWRRPAPLVKVSSSSRWLFSSVATETADHNNLHHDEIAASATKQQQQQHKTVPCSFPTPWLLRFRNSSGSRGGGTDGWA